MRTEAAFWDTIAKVPVCCVQEFSSQVRRTYRNFKKPVIWWGPPVGMHSAFGRLHRTGVLTVRQTSGALRLWENFRANSRTVIHHERTTLLAEELSGQYELRSLDAFQLAAALVWCKEKSRKRRFICADSRLGEAATRAGFDVVILL